MARFCFTDKTCYDKAETVNVGLKNICQIEHTRHRCVYIFPVNLFYGLIAYSFSHKKEICFMLTL